jgi:hypothetical protein
LFVDEQNLKGPNEKEDTDGEDECITMLENDDDENNIGMNEALLVAKLEKENAFLRRIKLIIKWLERIAAESDYMKSIRQKLSSFPEKCFNWEYTLHHLKSQKNKGDKTPFFGREYITELVRHCRIQASFFGLLIQV